MIPRIGEIEEGILALQKERDESTALSREIIRITGRCVTMMHCGERGTARELLKKASELLKKLGTEARPDYNSLQAFQEYTEAAVLYSILDSARIPSDKELGVEGIPYLLGLLDTVGELKREVFEALRKNEKEKAEAYYSFMAEIHDSLLPLRFSSSLIPDFRKKQDVARIQLESVGSELLSFRKG